PVCGSAKPERTHSRTSSRLMCAVGIRRWSAQYLATLVLPAPAGPMSRTAMAVPDGPGAAVCGAAGTATGPPGGSGTRPVVAGGGPTDACRGRAARGRAGARDSPAAGAGRARGRDPGALPGGAPGGVRPVTSRRPVRAPADGAAAAVNPLRAASGATPSRTGDGR